MSERWEIMRENHNIETTVGENILRTSRSIKVDNKTRSVIIISFGTISMVVLLRIISRFLDKAASKSNSQEDFSFHWDGTFLQSTPVAVTGIRSRLQHTLR